MKAKNEMQLIEAIHYGKHEKVLTWLYSFQSSSTSIVGCQQKMYLGMTGDEEKLDPREITRAD